MNEKAETEEAVPEKAKKGSKILLIAIPVALLLGGGAFYGVYSGMIPLPFGDKAEMADGPDADKAAAAEPLDAEPMDEMATAFLPVETIVISLAPEASAQHLKLSVQLEVDAEKADEVGTRLPRVVDVLNTFLRAVEVSDLERPRSMIRLRAQMLRRVQLVAGPGAIHDLLIQEFVLN
ncbi:MAG: flagellar basal body-associated FliL family protein [Pseudomonadota bacterium]